MDRKDELRKKLGEILANPWGVDLVDNILSLLATVLADAEKWQKVKEIAGRWEHPFECCEDCVLNSKCGGYCREAYFIVQALEGEGEKG